MKINKKIIKTIKNAKHIALFTHASPDGDAIGSSFALKYALEKLSKKVSLFIEEIPDNFSFLNLTDYKTAFDYNNYDLFISVDVSESHLLGKFESEFLNFNSTLSVDHHYNRNSFAKQEVVESCCSSNAEIIYYLIKDLKVKLDDNIASLLYIGVATDTGCFLYSNTNGLTHYVASELLNYNVNLALIHKKLFQTSSLDKFKLTQLVYNNYECYEDFIFVVLDSKILNASKIEDIHSYNLANILLELENMNFACIALEKTSGEFKMSFRSNFCYDCSKLANAFGGGGHKQAAGALYKGTKDMLKKKLIKEYKSGKTRD